MIVRMKGDLVRADWPRPFVENRFISQGFDRHCVQLLSSARTSDREKPSLGPPRGFTAPSARPKYSRRGSLFRPQPSDGTIGVAGAVPRAARDRGPSVW
jgi:hypothetical protein